METFSPAANYMTRNNIVHPRSDDEEFLAEQEQRARDEHLDRYGIEATGGSITRGQ